MRIFIALYVTAHLFAFVGLRYTFLSMLRWYCLAAAVQGSISLWPWRTEDWWRYCWPAIEPFMLLLRAALILELGYYAMARMYPEERRHLAKAALAVAAVGAFLVLQTVMHGTLFTRLVTSRNAVQVGMAMLSWTGVWYFWIRPQPGLSRRIQHHAYLLCLYLSVKAGVGLVSIDDSSPLYWIINGVYLASISLLMAIWTSLVALPRYGLPGLPGAPYRGVGQESEISIP